MRRLSVIVIMLALAEASAPGQASQDGGSTVLVYIDCNAGIPSAKLLLAQAIARKMFAQANVYLKWPARLPSPDSAAQVIVVDQLGLARRSHENIAALARTGHAIFDSDCKPYGRDLHQ